MNIIDITKTNLLDLISCYIADGSFPRKYSYGVEVLSYVYILNNVLVYKGRKEYFICSVPSSLIDTIDKFKVEYKKAVKEGIYTDFEKDLKEDLGLKEEFSEWITWKDFLAKDWNVNKVEIMISEERPRPFCKGFIMNTPFHFEPDSENKLKLWIKVERENYDT